jgi:hypothetical protein
MNTMHETAELFSPTDPRRSKGVGVSAVYTRLVAFCIAVHHRRGQARVFGALVVGAVALCVLASARAGVSGGMHSPAEVARVFAAHDLRLTPVVWNLPRGGPTEVAALSSGPLLGGPFDLEVIVWWSVSAAEKDAATPPTALPGLPPDKSFREVRAGNVTASYDLTAATAAKAARVAAALAALADTPTVAEPATGLVPLSSVAQPTRLVNGSGLVRDVADDWWCGLEHLVNGVSARTPECAPWDGANVTVAFGLPISLIGPHKTQPLVVGGRQRPRLVGVTKGTRLNIYSFPFGPVASVSHSAASLVASGVGLRFGGSGVGWSCVPRTAPQHLFCYRTYKAMAESPFLLVYPGERVVKVETLAAPQLDESQPKIPSYTYWFGS